MVKVVSVNLILKDEIVTKQDPSFMPLANI